VSFRSNLTNLALKEGGGGGGSVIEVCKVRPHNDQSPSADGVANGAVNLKLTIGKVRDRAAVLQVLGIPEEDDTPDLVPDGRGEPRDGIGHDGSTLAVAASDDCRVGTLGVRHVEHVLGLGDGGVGGSLRQEVARQVGCVRQAHALDPDLTTPVLGFQSHGHRGSSRRALPSNMY